ncbi:O-antigen ligase family protein [Flavobacterium sp. xlx-214]|uniref:O-antigen ligase family protein n=1 Tax=unclassified Flavobacterium TaxID=196869 RepID=UPI0013D4BCAB|nr:MULTISPECIES: O-antigen ligase family protein [unclassified Flavobacterium]MBA5792886.1 O-antigen ligase family protein [Flavobacterium sp. xlx-221]QMI84780.1 O-antigen ligase family protein [Flavobacterium sp. xlx-214]
MKKGKQNNTQKTNPLLATNENSSTVKYDASNTVSLLFLVLYLLIPFVSSNKYQDFQGLHWLLLSILNGLLSLYLFFDKDQNMEAYLPKFLKSKIYIAYIIFTIISGISIINAFNVVESLVQYSRLLNIVITFTLLGLLFVNRKNLFPKIAFIITITSFLETFFVLQDFYQNTKNLEMMSLILDTLKWTTGSKNIFVICLVVKLPFILYTFINKKGAWKYFALLTLFLTSHVVYLSITRTAFVGMILVFVSFFIGSFLVKKINNKHSIIAVSIATVVCIFGCFLGQLKIDSFLKKISLNNSNSAQATSQVLAKLEDSEGNVRFKYWEASLDIIKENPLLGVGYGNYKLYTPKYVKFLLADGSFSKHPHNDFIFVASESGVIAVILYISVFLIALFILVKNILQTKDNQHKLINLTLITSLGICLLDALFNFPKERPVTQLLLILLFVFTIAFNLKKKDTEAEIKPKSFNLKLISGVSLGFSIVMIFTNYTILNSMRAQGLIDTDFVDNTTNGKALVYNYKTASEMLPSYPNISEMYDPTEVKLAKYLRAEGRNDEAIKLLQNSKKVHPYYADTNYTIANIYYHSLKNNDSAYVYSLKALQDKPKNFDVFKLAAHLTSLKGKSNEIVKLYNEFTKYNEVTEENYSFYCQVLYGAKYPNNDLNKIVKEGLKKFPNSVELPKLSAYLDTVITQ